MTARRGWVAPRGGGYQAVAATHSVTCPAAFRRPGPCSCGVEREPGPPPPGPGSPSHNNKDTDRRTIDAQSRLIDTLSARLAQADRALALGQLHEMRADKAELQLAHSRAAIAAVETLCQVAEAKRDAQPFGREIPAVLTSDEVRAALVSGATS